MLQGNVVLWLQELGTEPWLVWRLAAEGQGYFAPTLWSNGIEVTRTDDFLAFLELCFDEDH